MKKLLIALCGLILWSHTTFAATDTKAVQFVDDLADDIITNVLTANVSQEQKLNTFRTHFQKALDLRSIGQFVLGVYWKSASESDREAFLTAFIDFATKSWADKFTLYTGQKITFSGTRPAQKGQLYVDSQIQNNPPAEVIWRLRDKDGTYKIVDIVIEGVSMAMSYRNEYTAYLQKNGGKLSTLTKELEAKSAAFKFTEQK